MEYVWDVLMSVLALVNEMSPYLLLGFWLAGLMHAFIPAGWYVRYLSGNTVRSVANAALFGIPLPLCSCGVIPTAMSLRREGASKGAVTSFLIATPQTGVDSIFATYSLMGLPFAVVRPIAALLTAVFGGSLVNMVQKSPSPTPNHPSPTTHHPSSRNRFIESLRYGLVEMMGDIGKWLVVGLIVAGLITVLVPDTFFDLFRDNTVMSMLLVLVVSIPMYICATGSIPIAVALMLKGLTPGAALVMLMAGPACNVASMLVVSKVLGRRTLAMYLASIIGGAVLFGFAVDYLLPSEWFISNLSASATCSHEGASWIEWASTVILVLLLLNVIRMKLTHRDTCCCNSHHDHECHCQETNEEYDHECHCHETNEEHHHECHCHEDNEEHHHECHCHE